jgi:hypothetical protein
VKKSQLRKLIRESIKELVNEQQATGCPPNGRQVYFNTCGPSSAMSSNPPSLSGQSCVTVDGQVPQVGQIVEIPFQQMVGNNIVQMIGTISTVNSQEYTGTGSMQFTQHLDLPSVLSCEGDTGSTGSKGCSLQDFQQAASGITLPAPFLGNIYNKFANHPDGCRFLNKRMQIQMQGSSNPTASAQKANKVQAFQAIIAQCCN